jgi:hypothetical protein
MRVKVHENGAYCVTVAMVTPILQCLQQVDRSTMQFFGNAHTLVMVEILLCRFILLQDDFGTCVVVARNRRAGRCLMHKSNDV